MLRTVFTLLSPVGMSSEPQAKNLFFVTRWKCGCFAFAKMCENHVHGSVKLATNEILNLTVRPEPRRKAPKEFSQSLSLNDIQMIAKHLT